MVYFDLAGCCYWNINYIMFQWLTVGLFSKCTKNVNINSDLWPE